MNLLDARICIPLDSVAEPFDPAPSPEALAIDQDSRRRITRLFYDLFNGQDATILLELYLDGLTAADVAMAWDMTEHQIDYIRRKSLKVLRTNPAIRALLCPTATT